jgi:CDP-glycerol glycerophosphotransferase
MNSFLKLFSLLFCKANLKRFAALVLFSPVTLLAKLVPKKKNLVLLGARYGTYFDWEPSFVFSHLCRNPDAADFEFFWVCRGKEVYEELKQQDQPVLKLYSPKAIWACLRASIIVISTSPADIDLFLTAGATVVHTYHGMPIRKVAGPYLNHFAERISNPALRVLVDLFMKIYFAMRVEAKADYVITTSEFANGIWDSQYQHGRDKYRILGNARNDVLFETTPPQIKKSPDETIISYLPTDRGTTGMQLLDLFNCFGFDRAGFEAFLERNNARFLLKCHHRQFGVAGLKEMFENSERMFMYSGQDVMPVLKETDVLISDYSSVSFNFLMQNRPIILGAFDIDEYEAKLGFTFDFRNEMPGPICADWSQVFSEVEKAMNSDPWAERRKKVLDRLYDQQDGNSCARIVMFLNMLTKGEPV